MFNVGKRGKVFMGTVLFVLGVVGIFGFSTNTTYAAGAVEAIGIVDYQYLLSHHPDTAKVEETMNAAIAQAKSDFDAKSANMSDQDKQALYQQLQQGLQQKNQALLGPIDEKVMIAVKSVADAKGLTTVVNTGTVIYGGQEITKDVEKAFTGK